MEKETTEPFLNMRLIALAGIFIGLIMFKDIERYLYPDISDTFKSIPMYNELNVAFEELKDFLKYNSELLMEIHNIVHQIVDIKINNKDSTSIIDLQLQLRELIDEMKLYIPNDIDYYSLWDTNVKVIIQTTQNIIKEIIALKKT